MQLALPSAPAPPGWPSSWTWRRGYGMSGRPGPARCPKASRRSAGSARLCGNSAAARWAPTLVYDALSYGPEAAALGITQGTVRAVLHQAVYLESQEGLMVGLVGAEAPDGPLSVRVADFPALHV